MSSSATASTAGGFPGLNNVIANYRFGSGGTAPAASTLTVIVNAQPGLTAIRNPVAAGGGANPQPSSQVRQYAPLSVLAFGRAVSGDDYETIASLTPGSAAPTRFGVSIRSQQRTMVTVYVGNDRMPSTPPDSLAGDSDPNRPVTVLLADEIPVQLQLTLEVDSIHDPATVVAAAKQALIDPDAGLFGANRIGIGEVIYRSRILRRLPVRPRRACGARSEVRTSFLPFLLSDGDFSHFVGSESARLYGYRFDPGAGAWFALDPANLNIAREVNDNAG